jgi:glucose-6-phosphate isomerase
MGFVRCDQTPAWAQLHAHQAAGDWDIRAAFARDPLRAQRFSQSAAGVWVDFSKTPIHAETEDLLLALAKQCGVADLRDAMFAGEAINTTEQRQVMHWLLRQPAGSLGGALAQPLAQVHETLDAMLAYAERVRADPQITDVVHMGIGGSDLGPQMVVGALHQPAVTGKRFHFVSNVDGHELAAVLQGLKPQHTLFLIASKTFTTAETMLNAHSAREWFVRQGGQDTARHFAALTSNRPAAADFGIRTTFGFWDWVGGRYSLWSAIGLPIAIALGEPGFRQMLAGAHAMDRHFCGQPLSSNLPVRMGLLDVWMRNFQGHATRGIAPYHSGLRRLPAFLQQLEMESNGKSVDRHGQPLPYATAPVLWGEPGTNGQHAFFQMVHQGSTVVPMEFIAVREATHDLPGHQRALLANAVAQAQALLWGQSDAGGHRHFSGNRPSTFVTIDALTPERLGALIAFYEHRVFVSGAVWGINSFDQFGVELGKTLALDLAKRWDSPDMQGLDASTAGLLRQLK